MKRKKQPAKVMILIFTISILVLFGCGSNNPVAPPKQQNVMEMPTINNEDNAPNLSKGLLPNLVGRALPGSSTYPQYTAKLFLFDRLLGGFVGGILKVPNGSEFRILDNSIIPLVKSLLNLKILITMEVDLVGEGNNKELIYSFGPSGTRFDPPAEAAFKYGDLGFSDVTLYYVDENGKYIEQPIKSIDHDKKILYADISHFSRYALAHSQ